jgi:hypothetical protein
VRYFLVLALILFASPAFAGHYDTVVSPCTGTYISKTCDNRGVAEAQVYYTDDVTSASNYYCGAPGRLDFQYVTDVPGRHVIAQRRCNAPTVGVWGNTGAIATWPAIRLALQSLHSPERSRIAEVPHRAATSARAVVPSYKRKGSVHLGRMARIMAALVHFLLLAASALRTQQAARLAIFLLLAIPSVSARRWAISLNVISPIRISSAP